ncbi:transformer-2 protein homolog beta-like [Tachypleus tridentatus]|uniref:transformer-2 protein homolog beta-like n=1 Tax=Tachypleus tridentatus TaxID=6853 RepID=UPI003FCF3EFC
MYQISEITLINIAAKFSFNTQFLQAKERCNGIEIDGQKIRVDYSVTKRAHTPTPGIYMGKPNFPKYDGNYRGRSPLPNYRGHRYSHSRSRSCSPRANS